jgi:hypothetical protein
MENQKDKLIEGIKLYLRKNQLDGDTHFYEIGEWQKRDEDYLNDSEFVIISEGGLNFILNYGDSFEFYDLVESFGYIMEMGHSWSYGFYFEGELEQTKVSKPISYSEKLRDERWQRKRQNVREKANYKCQDCGSQEKLEVHHCYYKYGLEPWQYPIDSLRCLCSNCHETRGKIEMELRARLADLTTKELGLISNLVAGGMGHYPERKIVELVENLRIDKDLLKVKINEQLSAK